MTPVLRERYPQFVVEVIRYHIFGHSHILSFIYLLRPLGFSLPVKGKNMTLDA